MATPSFFRKKPVTISAMQFDGSEERADEIGEWMAAQGAPGVATFDNAQGQSPVLTIQTLEGAMVASPLDWVIRGVKGEFYPCKPDIFEATYESVS